MASEKVLIVDDVEAMRQLLRSILESMGLAVLEASTGKEALETMQKDNRDIGLILLDIELPDTTAFQWIETLKAKKLPQTPKICLVSGHRDKESVTKALQLGANGYMIKPIDMSVVKTKVADFLGLKTPTSDETRRVAANLTAMIVSLPNEVKINLTEISDQTFIALSPMEFKSNPNLTINVPGLLRLINLRQDISTRVTSCKAVGGQFELELKLSAVPARIAEKLRDLVDRGKKVV